jgi:hypothetical protein
LTPKWD